MNRPAASAAQHAPGPAKRSPARVTALLVHVDADLVKYGVLRISMRSYCRLRRS